MLGSMPVPLRAVGQHRAALAVGRAVETEDRGGAAQHGGVERALPVGAHDDEDGHPLTGEAVDPGEQCVDPGAVLVVHLLGRAGLGERVGLVDDQDVDRVRAMAARALRPW